MSMKSVYIIFFLFLLTHITGCAEDTQENTQPEGTGAAGFNLIWPDEDSNLRITQIEGKPIDCNDKNISIIRVDVYDGSFDNFLTGETFPCTAGEGTVYGIASGKDRIFKVSGRDSTGKIIYEGQKKGIEIITNKVIPVGYIEMSRYNNTPPEAKINISELQNVYIEGETITFTGSGFDQEDGELSGNALVWTLNGEEQIGTGDTCTVSSLGKGQYTITLTVTDDDKATDRFSFSFGVTTKENQIPKVKIVSPEPNDTYDFASEITFIGTGTDAEDDNKTLGFEWALPDGKIIGTTPEFSKSDLPAGTYEITLRVKDKDGGMGTATVVITVKENQIPDAKIILPVTGTYIYGDPIEFYGTGEDIEDDDDTLEFLWTSSIDKEIGNKPQFTISDLSAGTHTITLTVTDKYEDAGTDTVDINISNKFTNTIGMTFKVIYPGTFTMGSPEDELGWNEDEIEHKVTLTRFFYLQTTEVTQSQWEAVLTAAEDRRISIGGLNKTPSYFTSCGGNCPVENVSWDDVQVFISVLNQLGDGTYRLPTEAEWEYAARAGSRSAFTNGDITETDCVKDNNLNQVGWYCWNSAVTYDGCWDLGGYKEGPACAGPHPVAHKYANAWNIYDMHGSVWEWCQDLYGDYPPGDVVDPLGPDNGTDRILRGGGWSFPVSSCRSAKRRRIEPDYYGSAIGFRLVRSSGP